jgi:hypothetical protein
LPVISDLALTITPYTALYTSPVLDANIVASENTVEGRNAVVLDFNAGDGLYSRDIGCAFSWPIPSSNVLYEWQPSLIPMPEGVYNRPGDWDDGGTPGAKFIQGVIVDADSFNVAKTFALQSSDDLALHTLLECPATFAKRTEIAFSCVPFIAHSARLVSTDAVEWRVWGSRLVFQPYPELTKNWTTEMTSLGLTGWGHLRELNIPYVSTSAVTLVINFDAWPQIAVNLPSTGGLMQKVKITMPSNKFKLAQFALTSAAGFRVFASDLEVKLGQWGRTDAYSVAHPFGGPDSTGAVV